MFKKNSFLSKIGFRTLSVGCGIAILGSSLAQSPTEFQTQTEVETTPLNIEIPPKLRAELERSIKDLMKNQSELKRSLKYAAVQLHGQLGLKHVKFLVDTDQSEGENPQKIQLEVDKAIQLANQELLAAQDEIANDQIKDSLGDSELAMKEAEKELGQSSHSVDVKAFHLDLPKMRTRVPAIHIHIPAIHVHKNGEKVDISAINIDIPKMDFSTNGIHIDIPAIHVNVPSVDVSKDHKKN